MGTAFGGAIAAVVSQQSAPPGATLEAVHAAAEAARGNAAETAPAAMPQPEATAEARPEVEAAPSEEAGEAAEPAPETPIVVVPAGSEFAKAKPDEDPATPATEAAAEATEAPEVSEPAAEGSPDLAEVSTAAQPESQTEAPAAPEAPVVSEETVASAAPAGDDASPAGVAATEPAGQLATENAGNALPQLPQSTEAAPAATGEINGLPFEWIADADMRLGPLLEIIINGRYFWMPFTTIGSMVVEPPKDLRDCVWMPATLTLRNGGDVVALIPSRYAGTVIGGNDAARLSRSTDWRDAGADTFLGVGQRLLATDAGDTPIMELRTLSVRQDGAGTGGEAGADG